MDILTPTIDVHLAPVGYTDTGQVWQARDGDGNVLVERHKDPVHEACRVLAANGYDGIVRVLAPTGTVSSYHDVNQSAQYRIAEGRTQGPVRTKWYPFESQNAAAD